MWRMSQPGDLLTNTCTALLYKALKNSTDNYSELSHKRLKDMATDNYSELPHKRLKDIGVLKKKRQKEKKRGTTNV